MVRLPWTRPQTSGLQVGEAVPEEVPEHHLPVVAGGGERAPVRAERNPIDGALAALEGWELGVVVRGVPEHDLAVVAGGGERAPVRAERDTVDGLWPLSRAVSLR